MSHAREQLKQRRLRALSRQYERTGYRIIVHPDRAARPDFLARFAPDLLAYSVAENVVVNLEFREDLVGNDAFVALAAAIEAAPGWRFDLEIISLDEVPVVGKEATELGAGEIRERIAAARQLFSIGQEEAALLLTFTAVEATLRRLARGNAVDLDRPQVASLLSQLIWEGLIDREDYEFLRQALRYRNTIVQGYQTPEIQGDLAGRLIAWVEVHSTMSADPAAT